MDPRNILQYRRQQRHLGHSLRLQLDNKRSYKTKSTLEHCEAKNAKGGPFENRLTSAGAEERLGEDFRILKSLGHAHDDGHTNRDDDSKANFLVGFTKEDTLNPRTWSNAKKWFVTMVVGAVGFICSGAAAFDTEVVPNAQEEYHVSPDVALLATVLYMIFFGLGTLFSAPFSETFGRTPVYIIGLTIFMLFTVGSAYAPNIESWLICRSFMGLFGSPPAVTFGGSMSDMWSPLERVFVFPILAALTFLGPFLAPTVADFVATSPHVSWHFVEWLTLLLSGVVCLLIALFVGETYAPALLAWKADHLRRLTGDERYVSSLDNQQTSFVAKMMLNARRPWTFLFEETIVVLFSIYLVIIYIVLFGTLVAFSYIFGREGAGRPDLAIYYLSRREVGLCYIPMNVGFIIGLLPCYPISRRFTNLLAKPGIERVLPEEHLWWALISAPLLPISLFWMAGSSKPDVSIWSPLVASGLFGFASLCIFIACYQYIIDTYEKFAASALVGMTVTRYVASAPMLIGSTYMYEAMGVQNALIVWACVSLPMTVVPYWFYFRGGRIRLRSERATKFGTVDQAVGREVNAEPA